MGGGAFHPRRKRQAGGWEQGRACTQGQGHRAWWPEAGLGKGTVRVPTYLGAALVLLLAGEGLETKKTDSILYLPSHHPEQVKEPKGTAKRVADRATWPYPCIFSSVLLAYLTSAILQLGGASPPSQLAGRPLSST